MASSLPGKANMRENNQNLKISRKSLSNPYTSHLSGKVRWDNCSKFQLVSSGQSMRYWYWYLAVTRHAWVPKHAKLPRSCHRWTVIFFTNWNALYGRNFRTIVCSWDFRVYIPNIHPNFSSPWLSLVHTILVQIYIYLYITWYNFPHVFKLLLNFIWTTFQPSSYSIVHSLERRVNAFFSENLHVEDIQK